MTKGAGPGGSAAGGLTMRTCEDGTIWSHVRGRWLLGTPEELVRQQYLLHLVEGYGWGLDVIGEELSVTGRGAARARADFAIWRTVEDKNAGRPPLIIVECKSDNVAISAADYHQGDNYARLSNAQFVVTHNNRETRYWRVLRDRMPGYLEEIEDIPTADASNSRIKYLLENLRTFREDEFAFLLGQCHNVIRDRDHLDPAAAFDEIAKILFLKTTIERRLREGKSRRNLFTAEFLDEQREFQADPVNSLFVEAKNHYSASRIFAVAAKISLRYETTREIVRLLERYNLSDTAQDIKGIAFERFLGRTFRGEIGQFFTPRPVVHLMVRMMDPQEGERIIDPASGSGGFLIHAFERVRDAMAASVDAEYANFRATFQQQPHANGLTVLNARYAELSRELDGAVRGTRAWHLANRWINGVDANDRMARTSKMNMIMHGDGHGGVFHGNGLIDLGTVVEGHFDVVMTNPPFGSDVPGDALLHEADIELKPEVEIQLKELLGRGFDAHRRRLRARVGRPILEMFEMAGPGATSAKTEVLFLERSLDLLTPGGRMAIVLPEGILSNPTSQGVREHCELRAYLRAVVSLPKDTFKSTSADVRTSIVVLQRFTPEQQADEAARRVAAIDQASVELEPEHKQALAAVASTHRAESAAYRTRVMRLQVAYDSAVASRAARIYWNERHEEVFLYEASDAGITATGEPTTNELYPNELQPDDVDKTCIEHYETFRVGAMARDLNDSALLHSRAFLARRSELARWDVKSARAAQFRRAHPDYVALDQFLEDATVLVNPASHPDKLWPIYGVSNVNGVFLASETPGNEIRQRYKRIRKDNFFHNPTRANVGSLGRVGDVPEDAITSPEYQVWRIRPDAPMLADFIEVLLKTSYFLRLVDIHRRGAVKERLYLDNLLEIPIPPLSLPEQRIFVDRWNVARSKVEAARRELHETVELLDRRMVEPLNVAGS